MVTVVHPNVQPAEEHIIPVYATRKEENELQKQSRRRQAAQKKVLNQLEQGTTKLQVLAGRYGPYVTDGTTNASIPKGTAAETLTFEQATELLEAMESKVGFSR